MIGNDQAPAMPREPGSIRRALFQDVPYILDSLWRWTEFRANRVGQVDLDGKAPFALRPARRTPIFLLFLLVSTFLAFGPTSDSLCALAGERLAGVARVLLGAAAGFGSVALLLALLNAATSRLARKAESAAIRASDGHPELAAQKARIDTVRRKFVQVLRTEPSYQAALGDGTRILFEYLARFFTAARFITRVERRALGVAFAALVAGSVLTALPFFTMAATLIAGKPEAALCERSATAGAVLWQVVAWVAVLSTGAILWRTRKDAGEVPGWKLFVSIAVVWLVGVALLWGVLAPAAASEAAGGAYPHSFGVIVAALVLVAGIAWILARWIFRAVPAAMREAFRKQLGRTELLHNERPDPDVATFRLWAAFVNGVLYHPWHFLLLPSFVVFMAPTALMYWLAAGFAVVSAVLLMYGSLSTRWEQMILFVTRWFWIGTPRIVSLAVIATALMRLWGVQYVATVIDAAPIGVLFVIVVMTYCALWFFEYWTNRWAAERLLALLDPRNRAAVTFLDYPYVPAEGVAPKVLADRRILAIHGTGRFCAHGRFERDDPIEGERPVEFAFTTYGLRELFEVLAPSDNPEYAHEIARRVRMYFALVNAILVVSAILLYLWHRDWARPLAQQPMVRAEESAVPIAQSPDLAALLRSHAREPQRPLIVVAASGGGTRAAVYTATALEGLARLGHANDVALVSGVSGGGVAAAYFASRFAELSKTPPTNDPLNPWRRYRDAMGEPFIRDVLEGVGELRIAANAPLGVLLTESLERRLFKTSAATLGDLRGPGLILNTAVSGHPYGWSQLLNERIASPRPEDTCVAKSRPFAPLAGSRLIFTNLQDVSGFVSAADTRAPDMRLPYAVVRDPGVPIAAAAALSANFPPLFSNARVRLKTEALPGCEGYSYFITDGGATENLGLVSALYALRGTLTTLLTSRAPPTTLPPIHIVAVEASAVSYDYREDRGLGAATGGAKERINAGLTHELIKSIDAQLAPFGRSLQVHYLPLPVAFRSRGGFGTHWMFAREVHVANPLLPVELPPLRRLWRNVIGEHIDVSLDRQEVQTVWSALFDPSRPFCEREAAHREARVTPPGEWTRDVARVAAWICGIDGDARLAPDAANRLGVKADYQVGAWQALRAAL
jgi:hypothetical protein